MKYSQVALAALIAFISSTAKANQPAKPWTNSTEVSVISANGNTKSSTSSGKNVFLYKWTKTTLEVIGYGTGSRNKENVTAENYYASEKLSYKLSDRNYAFEIYKWYKDRFSGVRHGHDASAGLGREIMKDANDLLIAEAGLGYINEQRIASPRIDFAAYRLYSKYVRTLSPTSSFSQDVEFKGNLEDPDDFRTKTETAVTSALSTHLSLKLSYVWKYVGVPPGVLSHSDTTTIVSLIANY